MSELLELLLKAAIFEAQLNPRMMERDGDLYWRGVGGGMTRITSRLPLNARIVSFTDNSFTWDVP